MSAETADAVVAAAVKLLEHSTPHVSVIRRLRLHAELVAAVRRHRDAPPSADPQSVAAFELEQADVRISDVWRAVFGPAATIPKRRSQTLSRIMGMCLNVEWPWRREERPSLALMPVGVEVDDDPS